MSVQLNKEEIQATADLIKLAKRWPKSLWLYSAGGTLHVMKCGPQGERVVLPERGGGVDPAFDVGTVDIPNDGGDW